jgi:hypothetical protein
VSARVIPAVARAALRQHYSRSQETKSPSH